MTRLILFVICSAVFISFARADGDGVVSLQGVPTASQWKDNLFPKDPCEALKEQHIKCRGIRPVPRAISLDDIEFNFNSSQLTDDAKEKLAGLGKVLQERSSDDGYQLEIIGHTDTSGTKTYNRLLSLKRAMSVKVFLITDYNIPAEHLIAVGRGFDNLKDKEHPTSQVNRRVEFRREK